MRKSRGLAMASGLLAGIILFLGYGQIHPEVYGYGYWGIEQYEAALLCAAIGLSGLLEFGWPWSSLCLGFAAALTRSVPHYLAATGSGQTAVIPEFAFILESFAYGLWSFPPAIIGGLIGRWLKRRQPQPALYFGFVFAGFALSASLPVIEKLYRQYIETRQLPELLRHIYDDEVSFARGRPDRGFTCDPNQLPSVSNRGWTVFQETAHLTLAHNRYEVQLDCGELGLPAFRAYATSVPKLPLTATPDSDKYAHIDHQTFTFAIYIDNRGELLVGPDVARVRRQHLENEDLPALLKRLYDAEMSYRAKQPDKDFTCDGRKLEGIGKQAWWILKNVISVDNYRVELRCPIAGTPQKFQITASDASNSSRFSISIDEDGNLRGN